MVQMPDPQLPEDTYPEYKLPEDTFPEDWDDQLLAEDDFDLELDEAELDLLRQLREEAGAAEWLIATEWSDETRDQPDD